MACQAASRAQSTRMPMLAWSCPTPRLPHGLPCASAWDIKSLAMACIVGAGSSRKACMPQESQKTVRSCTLIRTIGRLNWDWRTIRVDIWTKWNSVVIPHHSASSCCYGNITQEARFVTWAACLPACQLIHPWLACEPAHADPLSLIS